VVGAFHVVVAAVGIPIVPGVVAISFVPLVVAFTFVLVTRVPLILGIRWLSLVYELSLVPGVVWAVLHNDLFTCRIPFDLCHNGSHAKEKCRGHHNPNKHKNPFAK
jgi:hypothetical protein